MMSICNTHTYITMQLEDKALFYILYDCIVNGQKKMMCIT